MRSEEAPAAAEEDPESEGHGDEEAPPGGRERQTSAGSAGTKGTIELRTEVGEKELKNAATAGNFMRYMGGRGGRAKRLGNFLWEKIPEKHRKAAARYVAEQKRYLQEEWEETFEDLKMADLEGEAEETGHKQVRRKDEALPQHVKDNLCRIWSARCYAFFVMLFLVPGVVLLFQGVSEMFSLVGATQAECRMSEFQPKRTSAEIVAGTNTNKDCSIGSCELIVTAFTRAHGIFTVDKWMPEYSLKVDPRASAGVLVPVHEVFSCCPQPSMCCDMFQVEPGKNETDGNANFLWCDNRKAFDSSCPAGPWQCYFYDLETLLQKDAAIAAGELYVGSIFSYWPRLLAGVVLSGCSVALFFSRQLTMLLRRLCAKRPQKKPRSGKLDNMRKSSLLREYARMLGKVAMFQQLEAEALYELAKEVKRVEYVKQDYIIVQGDEGDAFFLLYEGCVAIDVGGKVVAQHEVDPREETEKAIYFGERALLSAETRAASVQVTSDEVTTLTLSKSLFQAFVDREQPGGQLGTATEAGMERMFLEIAEKQDGNGRSALLPPMAPPPKPRGLLYDTGDVSTFRRTTRVCLPVKADANGNMRIEVAMDEHAGELGATLVELLSGWQPPHVQEVRKGTLAARAGLEIGDMLVQVNKHVFPTVSAQDLAHMVRQGPRPTFLAFSRWPRGSEKLAEACDLVRRNSRPLCVASSPPPPRRDFAVTPPRGTAPKLPGTRGSTRPTTSSVIDLTGDGQGQQNLVASMAGEIQFVEVPRPPRQNLSYTARLGGSRRGPRRPPQVQQSPSAPSQRSGSTLSSMPVTKRASDDSSVDPPSKAASDASSASLPGQLNDHEQSRTPKKVRSSLRSSPKSARSSRRPPATLE